MARALAAQRGEREIIVVHVIEDEHQAEAARTQLDAYVAQSTGAVAIRAELVVGAPEDSLLSF
ncbi:MAG TPA: hypothetical protein VLB44_02555, partial [Kofleriaceae bacterium]|nr:hypothetical protein [Kofleriaceae bacterium]